MRAVISHGHASVCGRPVRNDDSVGRESASRVGRPSGHRTMRPTLGLVLMVFSLICFVGTTNSRAEGEAELQEIPLGKLKVSLPATWMSKPSASQMRLAQFTIPAAEGDAESAEMVVFHFGKGGAGAAGANVERWIKQFEPKGRTVKLVEGKSSTGDYTLVDLAGTYQMPVGPPIQQKTRPLPEARVINVMLRHEDGPLFLKLAGPQKTVSAAIDDFRKAFGLDASTEQEQKTAESTESGK